MHVAVAAMADAADARAVLGRQPADLAPVPGHAEARHDDVDDVVGAVLLGDPEALPACVEDLLGRTVGQHVHIGHAELHHELGQRQCVPLEPVSPVVLQADEQVAHPRPRWPAGCRGRGPRTGS